MTGLVSLLEQLPPLVVLALAVMLVMGETGTMIGMFFPVEITLLFVGFLAYLGEVPFAPTLLLMIAAAVAGDALALRSGRKYGPRLRASRFGARVGEERWARADRSLHRLGGRSAFIARWVPVVRTVLPRLAGSAGMPYRRFAPWNIPGVMTEVGSSVVVGYLAGASYERAAELFGDATTAVLLLLLGVVAIVLIGRWLGRHPYPVRTLAARAGGLPPLRWLGRRHGALVRAVADRLGAGPALVLDLLAGLAVLVAVGLGSSWLVQLVVARSGLSRVDAAVRDWFAGRRTEPAAAAAEFVANLLSGKVVVAVVAVVALVLAVRARAWRGDLVVIFGTVGAFVPLLILAVVADLTGGDPAAHPAPAMGVFSTQTTVATAGLCTLAWLLTRRTGWPRAVTGWTIAAVGVVVLAHARLYLGWNTASETATAVMLGGMWIAVYMIAWGTRARAGGGDDPAPPVPSLSMSHQPH